MESDIRQDLTVGLIGHTVPSLCALAFFLLPVLVFAQAFPSTSVLDNFNRATLNGNWTNTITGSGNGCEIESSTHVSEHSSEGGGGCYWNVSTFNDEQEAFATLPNATNHDEVPPTFRGLMLCLQDTPNSGTVDGYGLRFDKRSDTDRLTIYVMQDASFNDIGSFYNIELDDGDKIGLRHNSDGSLAAYADTGGGWTSLFTRDSGDSNYVDLDCANTNIGLFFLDLTQDADDFGGGNVTSSPTTATGRGGFIQFQ